MRTAIAPLKLTAKPVTYHARLDQVTVNRGADAFLRPSTKKNMRVRVEVFSPFKFRSGGIYDYLRLGEREHRVAIVARNRKCDSALAYYTISPSYFLLAFVRTDVAGCFRCDLNPQDC